MVLSGGILVADIDELKWIRISDWNLVPGYLVKQVKGMDFPPERLYAFGEDIARNPFTLLFVLADEHHRIQGFLWGSVNPLDQSIMGHIFSLDKEYQDRGKPIQVAIKKLEEFGRNLGFERVKWQTTRPKAFERLGFERAEQVLMAKEIEEVQKEPPQ